MNEKSIIVAGGGAAGFFAAINLAEKNPDYKITILEKGKQVLNKVRISGGGRCNVTNARTHPAELIPFYPRGGKKLYKLFEHFSTSDMVQWLNAHGVDTHTEEDLRMFPVTNSSGTIIQCFLDAVKKHGIELIQREGIRELNRQDNHWEVITSKDRRLDANAVVIATGSSSQIWHLLKNMGMHIIEPVPSLFTFNIQHSLCEGLAGISFPRVKIKIAKSKLEAEGPMLITHWGLSGPAVLQLSSFGARELAEKKYIIDILVNFAPDENPETCRDKIDAYKQHHSKRKVINYPLFDLPRRFWERICILSEISESLTYGELGRKSLNRLTHFLTQAPLPVTGKSTFKEEFVTSGGVALDEINLQTFEARRFPGLYLCGEVLDIDALTGGFNFQACWSGAWQISQHL